MARACWSLQASKSNIVIGCKAARSSLRTSTQSRNRMGTQEVELPVSPTELLLRCVGEPFPFVFDGGSVTSWGSGHALFGYRPCATLHVTAEGEARVSHAGSV